MRRLPVPGAAQAVGSQRIGCRTDGESFQIRHLNPWSFPRKLCAKEPDFVMSARFSLATIFLFAALLVVPLFSPTLRAEEDPKVFGELGEGIAHARDGDRLLLFLLVAAFRPGRCSRSVRS